MPESKVLYNIDWFDCSLKRNCCILIQILSPLEQPLVDYLVNLLYNRSLNFLRDRFFDHFVSVKNEVNIFLRSYIKIMVFKEQWTVKY